MNIYTVLCAKRNKLLANPDSPALTYAGKKQPERALYRVGEFVGQIKPFPPLPYRVFPDPLSCFLKPARFRR
jgi:hypothetical protein